MRVMCSCDLSRGRKSGYQGAATPQQRVRKAFLWVLSVVLVGAASRQLPGLCRYPDVAAAAAASGINFAAGITAEAGAAMQPESAAGIAAAEGKGPCQAENEAAAVGEQQPAAGRGQQPAAGRGQQPAAGKQHEQGGGESIVQWAAAPGNAPRDFLTPHSRCAVRADGSVHLPGDTLAGGLPFLFDVDSMPPNEVACKHCGGGGHGIHCCGVCQFEGQLCRAQYPGQNKSEAVAEQLIQRGLRLQAFTPCELFQRIRGRTLWFMGDSQTWNLFYAAECFLREFAPSLRRTPALPPAHNMKLKVVEHVSAPVCLNLVHGTRVCAVRVDTAGVTLQHVLPRLATLVPDFANDILVYNVGLHYPAYDWAQPPGRRYVAELTALAEWRQRYKARLPHFVWVDTAPQHFATHEGTWPGRAYRPFTCQPLKAWYDGDRTVTAGTRRNQAAAPIIPRLADAHLRIYNATVPLWDVHLPRECSHYCHPSSYHLWLYLLNDVLRDSGLGSAVRVEAAR